jgi:hypothetical protein
MSNEGRDKPHWRLYHKLRETHPDLIGDLEDWILDYVEDRARVTGTEVVKAALTGWSRRKEWLSLTNPGSSSVLGTVIYDTLTTDSWTANERKIGNKKVKVYTR